MFTGIINSIGNIEALNDDVIQISTDNNSYQNLDAGTSIAIDGTCLTLRDYENDLLNFQVSDETFNRTIAKGYKTGSKINLELPATMSTFLSGHIVQGHVDTTSEVIKIEENENNLWTYYFKITDSKYIVDKGSITINGISLTVVDPDDGSFSVAVISETYQRTNLQYLKNGSLVNIEYDILAKYMEKMINDK
jgi:riboflavin synthase